MARFSITDLERLTGIKAHTLRVWEQRYNILRPARDSLNQRYYDDKELQRLLCISRLNQRGIKISKIADMSDSEIFAEDARERERKNAVYEPMLDAVLTGNEAKLRFHFKRKIGKYGVAKAYEKFLLPFLQQIKLMWMVNTASPIQAHFASALLRRLLIAESENLTVEPAENAPSFLLFAPADDGQELNLLLALYMIRAQGFNCTYLGYGITPGDYEDAKQLYQPDYVMTVLTDDFAGGTVGKFVQRLCEHFSDSKVIIAGYQAKHIPEPIQNLIKIPEYEDFGAFLNTLAT